MVAQQFLFPVLQMISAYILLYLAFSVFVPAASSENLLPWVIYLKYLQTAFGCPLHEPAKMNQRNTQAGSGSAIGMMPQSVLHGPFRTLGT